LQLITNYKQTGEHQMSMSDKLKEKRSALLIEAQNIVDKAEAEARDLTAEEDSAIATALQDSKSLDANIAHHEELEARSAQAKEVRKESGIGGTVIKSEARTYSPRAETSFLADAYAAQFNNDFGAKERLARHMNEEKIERRDVTSSNFAGLVVPQFLTDLAAPFARAGRPFLDQARKHALPDSGLVISISKVTTGSATAVQTEGATVQETNMDDTKLDVSIVTVAGQQNVSRQAIERGTNIDSLVMADLVSAYHTNLDSLFVTTSATSLTNVITQVVTYTDASPTVAELYPKLADCIQRIQTNFFAGPNFMLMHPRRLAFILASLDDQKRPLAVPVPNFNGQPAIASGNGAPVYGNSGYTIMGLPVITDANVTTTNGAGSNEDVIILGNTQEAHLFEQGSGEPMMLRFEQPKASELDVTMIVYGYSAFTANRYPNAFALVGGTGLVTPTF
jgi:HK97 family phage major capsid protein